MTDTFWNGEPAAALRGTAVVVDAPEFPQYWARAEGIVGQRIAVVRVSYCQHITYLDNRTGKGWLKVTKGFGSPRFGHADVRIEPDSFVAGGLLQPTIGGTS
ncbi:hypothetical protein P3H15_32720 [Rhodococcus sp. T2V]|uniref:hypothetical protein n=1 Tax=Rhodococcus sp. T2V TaxID=3034164 RepID=UPI0023E25DE0|nr:hypothetical protein [Rhodococcus sp. T2V]MDF3309784.1 hypothetical protein [Rhodococcus sp. T2V]